MTIGAAIPDLLSKTCYQFLRRSKETKLGAVVTECKMKIWSLGIICAEKDISFYEQKISLRKQQSPTRSSFHTAGFQQVVAKIPNNIVLVMNSHFQHSTGHEFQFCSKTSPGALFCPVPSFATTF